ncbi:MAG: MATE family efflux transporter [Oscillospiraceae bacterium]
METSNRFTEGKVLSPLIRFALPILFAIFLQTMYGAVDMLVVGQFSSAAEVSAVSTGSWIMQLITSLITGLAMGTTVVLGNCIGAGKDREGGLVVGTSMVLFFGIGIVLTFLLELFAAPFSQMMQAPAEAFASTVQYVRICGGGTLFIIAFNVLGGVFRGIGNAKLPLISVAIACVTNIAGDLLLVAGFGLGAAGAAAATVFAQAVSVILSLLIIRRLSLPFSFSRQDIRWEGKTIKHVMRLGFPIALQDVLVTISFLAITAIVNSLGVIPSAGVGVAEKVCGFVLMVPSAYMQAMSAFVAQNMGAGRPNRAKKALIGAIGTSLAIGIFLAYGTFFHGDLLAKIFARDPEVIAAAAEYLKAYAIDCLLVSFLFCMIGYFNGCSKTTFVMVQGIVGAFFVRIPVSWLMSRLEPVSLFRVGLATPSSTVVQILLCAIYFGWMYHREKKAAKAIG